jgi:hypothetical protein
MFPANPPQSEGAKEWADKVREHGPVGAHSEAIAEEAKASRGGD